MHALAPTPVPVPRTRPRAPRPRRARSPVLRHGARRGRRLPRRRATSGTSTRDARRRLGHAFVDALAALHLVDPAEVGLADFGRPDGYLARQVRRWTTQLASSRSRDVPGFDVLAATAGGRCAGRAAGVGRARRLPAGQRDRRAATTPAGCGRSSTGRWPPSATRSPTSALFTLFWEGWGGDWTTRSPRPPPTHGFPSAAELSRRYADATGLDLADDAWALDDGMPPSPASSSR